MGGGGGGGIELPIIRLLEFMVEGRGCNYFLSWNAHKNAHKWTKCVHYRCSNKAFTHYSFILYTKHSYTTVPHYTKSIHTLQFHITHKALTHYSSTFHTKHSHTKFHTKHSHLHIHITHEAFTHCSFTLHKNLMWALGLFDLFLHFYEFLMSENPVFVPVPTLLHLGFFAVIKKNDHPYGR